jgi:hypothetical protein
MRPIRFTAPYCERVSVTHHRNRRPENATEQADKNCSERVGMGNVLQDLVSEREKNHSQSEGDEK